MCATLRMRKCQICQSETRESAGVIIIHGKMTVVTLGEGKVLERVTQIMMKYWAVAFRERGEYREWQSLRRKDLCVLEGREGRTERAGLREG